MRRLLLTGVFAFTASVATAQAPTLPFTLDGSGVARPVGPSYPVPVTLGGSGGALTIVTLAVKLVTTGGTAVNAIAANGRTAGGWIQNPPTAPNNLCINEIGTATGTTSSGDTTCIVPGQIYTVAPGTAAVSVISATSSHAFSGMSFTR